MGQKLGKHYITHSLHEIRLPEKYLDWSFDNNKDG
jgi:hypothetical protein